MAVAEAKTDAETETEVKREFGAKIEEFKWREDKG